MAGLGFVEIDVQAVLCCFDGMAVNTIYVAAIPTVVSAFHTAVQAPIAEALYVRMSLDNTELKQAGLGQPERGTRGTQWGIAEPFRAMVCIGFGKGEALKPLPT